MQPPGRHFRQARSSNSGTLLSAEKLGGFEMVTLTGRTTVRRSGSAFFKRPMASSATGFCWSCADLLGHFTHAPCFGAIAEALAAQGPIAEVGRGAVRLGIDGRRRLRLGGRCGSCGFGQLGDR